MQTKEARLILGAAIVDDILAIAVLSVVTTMVQTGDTISCDFGYYFSCSKNIRVICSTFGWFGCYYSKNTSCREIMAFRGKCRRYYYWSIFWRAGIGAFVGLSPIVGAFSVGMAVATTRIIKQVEEYVSKLGIIFAPLFFAIIGAQVDLRGVNLDVLYLSGLIIAVAVVTKLVGADYQR